MILTTLPDLPPRPETAANAEFRRRFYARWGRENAVVCGHATHAEYSVFPQTLSFKLVRGGSERFYLARRQVAVDDDNWLVLNEGERYASLLAAPRPAWTFALFVRPGLQREVAAERARPLANALDAPGVMPRDVSFSQHLRPHGGAASARLAHIAAAVQAGERDETWLEEQCLALVDALLEAECRPPRPASPRVVQRAELLRRLRLAADFIHSHYAEPLTLERMAAAACLSRWHFVREFRAAFGLTPHAYLTAKRARAARRWLAAGATDREWVAQRCGFGSRWALRRALMH